MKFLQINGRQIGRGEPVYVVAEMSGNHAQSFDEAMKIVETAKEVGADAIKLQTYTADTLTIDCDNEHFLVGKGTLWEGNTLYKLYQEAHTPWKWQPQLMERARQLGMDCFSTPFDGTAVDFLEELNVPCHKIASFEIVDLPLLRKVARTGKPVILSTGMSTLAEIDEAVTTLRVAGAGPLALLKCCSAYPAAPEDMRLSTISNLAEAFGVPVGLSDHTLGIAVPVAAVALGACIIEKHFTLSRETDSPDKDFSLLPDEFADMVKAVRMTEGSLGPTAYGPTESEKASLVFRRSLFVTTAMAAGEEFSERNLRCIRPGYGMHSRYLEHVLGKRASRRIEAGTPLIWDLVS